MSLIHRIKTRFFDGVSLYIYAYVISIYVVVSLTQNVYIHALVIVFFAFIPLRIVYKDIKENMSKRE
jgi:hypothetical protein